jgi:hypothetical protein
MAYARDVRYSIIRSSSSMPCKQSPALTLICRNTLCRFQIPRFCSLYRHDRHQFHQPHNYIMKYVNDAPKVKSYQSLCDYLLHKQKIPLDILLRNFNDTLIYKRGALAWLLWLNTLNFSNVSPISLITTLFVVMIPYVGIHVTTFMVMQACK